MHELHKFLFRLEDGFDSTFKTAIACHYYQQTQSFQR